MFQQCRDVIGHEFKRERSIDVSGMAMRLQFDADNLSGLGEVGQNLLEHPNAA
jgi:hypothetical protein